MQNARHRLSTIAIALLWWWGPQPATTLQLVVAPVRDGCADPVNCTPAEVETTRALRAPQIIPNTWATMPAEADGYRRQLGVPDGLPVGWVIWWGELP